MCRNFVGIAKNPDQHAAAKHTARCRGHEGQTSTGRGHHRRPIGGGALEAGSGRNQARSKYQLEAATLYLLPESAVDPGRENIVHRKTAYTTADSVSKTKFTSNIGVL